MTFADRLIERLTRRPPDFVIGGERPYLRRWYVVPHNRLCNVYLHEFLRSDDDRALHTHPWANLSILLRGSYREHTSAGARDLTAGDWKLRLSGNMAHRIELTDGPCWTLFLTGPKYQEWGFLCPQGFVHWRDFTAPGDEGAVGRGCNA